MVVTLVLNLSRDISANEREVGCRTGRFSIFENVLIVRHRQPLFSSHPKPPSPCPPLFPIALSSTGAVIRRRRNSGNRPSNGIFKAQGSSSSSPLMRIHHSSATARSDLRKIRNMKTKKHEKNEGEDANQHQSISISRLQACSVHMICGLGLAVAFWVAHNLYSISLVSHPSPTLRLICIVEIPIAILLFSQFRLNPKQCSYFRAVGRSLLALPLGALVNAFGAIFLGAPIGIQHLMKTICWSLLMSSLTFVPAASAFGLSWTHWQRMFALIKPKEPVEFMICIPAHGAIIGAWFGAWPMPLDWERPWQEWPICVTYGAIMGYLVALVASSSVVLTRQGQHHLKRH